MKEKMNCESSKSPNVTFWSFMAKLFWVPLMCAAKVDWELAVQGGEMATQFKMIWSIVACNVNEKELRVCRCMLYYLVHTIVQPWCVLLTQVWCVSLRKSGAYYYATSGAWYHATFWCVWVRSIFRGACQYAWCMLSCNFLVRTSAQLFPWCISLCNSVECCLRGCVELHDIAFSIPQLACRI